VIGRATGGSRSDIDGKIQSNIVGANLYLIPSGLGATVVVVVDVLAPGTRAGGARGITVVPGGGGAGG